VPTEQTMRTFSIAAVVAALAYPAPALWQSADKPFLRRLRATAW
jgi:hypothetical protein